MPARNSRGQYAKKTQRRRRTSNTAMSPRRRTKYKNAFNIKKAGLGYATLSVATSGMFNVNPIEFVMGVSGSGIGSGFGAASGVSAISLRELFEFDKWKGSSNKTLGQQIMDNVKNNAFKIVGGVVAVKVADKVITSAGISKAFNSGIRGIGMGQLVKM